VPMNSTRALWLNLAVFAIKFPRLFFAANA
jgi:hypothetical protein